MIRDQRDMIQDPRVLAGSGRLTTVADVRAAWARAAVDRGLRLHDTDDTVTAYVSRARWVADCPNPECSEDGRGSEAAWPANNRWACLTCGVVCRAEFPSTADIEVADVVLSQRREVATRNWDPRTETVVDLQAQNVLMGDLPADFGGLVMDGRRLGPSDVLPQFQPGPRALPVGR